MKLAVKLERLYRIWQQLFVRYYATEAQVMALFDGRSRTRRANLPRHHVVFFRDQDDYNRSLRAAIARNSSTGDSFPLRNSPSASLADR